MNNQADLKNILQSQLEDCGLDADLLSSVFVNVHIPPSVSAIVLVRSITQTVVKKHISWTNSFDNQEIVDDELRGSTIPAPSALTQTWRPRESVLQLLCNTLELSRSDVGFCREEFKNQYKGTVFRDWNARFIQYALDKLITDDIELTKNTVNEASEIDEKMSFSEAESQKNMTMFDRLIREMMSEMHITPGFQFSETWQPSDWVVKKLRNMGMSKTYIYNDDLLKPFVKYHLIKQKMFLDYDLEYFHWARTRFPKLRRIREAEVEEIKQQQLG